MRSGFRFAARALVAAGALALTGQQIQARAPAPVVMASDSAAENRLIVFKVRLAWLADPALASYQLGIRPAGTMFEVCGFVPDDASRAQALLVARTASGHPIHDELILDASVHTRVAAQDNEKLAKAALALLHSQMKIEDLALTVLAPGRVEIMGTVRSVEDKVTASHKLLLVPGCTSAVNNLTVKTIARHGQEMTAVSADGNLAVFGPVGTLNAPEKTAQEPAEKVVHVPPHSAPAAQPAKQAAQPTNLISVTITSTPAAPPASDEAADIARRMHDLGTRSADAPSGPAVPVVLTAPAPAPTIVLAAKTETVPPTQDTLQEPYARFKSLAGVEQTSPSAEVPVVASPVMPTPDHPVVYALPEVPVERVVVPQEALHGDQESWTRRMLVLAMSMPSVDGVPHQPRAPHHGLNPLTPPPVVVTPLTPDNKWPTAFATKPKESEQAPSIFKAATTPALPIVATKSVPDPMLAPMVSSMVMPEPKSRPTQVESPVAVAEQKSPALVDRSLAACEMKPMPNPAEPESRSSQVVNLIEEMPAPNPGYGTAGVHESSRMKQEIEAQCGDAVSRVQMFNQADHTVLVRIFLKDAAAEKPVTDKLLQIPEVMQPGVKMELLVPE